MSKRRKIAIPEAKAALDLFKYEIAKEIGMPIEKGNFGQMTSHQYGYMIKKMIESQEKEIASKINDYL